MTRTLTKKRKLRHNSTDEKGSLKRTFFVAHKTKAAVRTEALTAVFLL